MKYKVIYDQERDGFGLCYFINNILKDYKGLRCVYILKGNCYNPKINKLKGINPPYFDMWYQTAYVGQTKDFCRRFKYNHKGWNLMGHEKQKILIRYVSQDESLDYIEQLYITRLKPTHNIVKKFKRFTQKKG